VDKKRDKLERKVLDSQERAFWDVHRPAVSPSLSVCLSVNLSEVKEFDGEGREGTVGIGTSG